MEKNNPPSVDPELEKIKKMNEGFVDPDEVTDPPKDPVDPKDPPTDPPKEPEKKDDPPKDPLEDPKPPTDPPVDPPKDPVDPPKDPVDPPKDPVDPPATRKPRRENYVPVNKYTDEKRQWRSEKEVLENKVTELTALAESNKNTPTEDAEVKAYAEKHGVEPDFVKGILTMARKGMEIPKEKLDQIDGANKIVQDQAEKDLYDTQWGAVEPSIKTQHPDATAEQLVEAKVLLDKVSHTTKYADKDLDYILFKEKDQFDAILTKADKTVQKPGQRTMDAGRQPGAGGPKKLTASDFKDDKDFEKLTSLPEDEKRQVVSSFGPLTYERYVKFETYRDDQGIEINRDGRKIILK